MKSPILVTSLATDHEHPCSYLPGRTARTEYLFARRVDPEYFEIFLESGFRRSGHMIYRPACRACRECRPMRVLVGEFQWNRALRRCWRANQDLTVLVAAPQFSSAKQDLYRRYLSARHDKESDDELESFLYDGPVDSLEIEFHLAGRLVCVAIADRIPSGLSAVYCYFDPDYAERGLGTYAVLWELEYCRRMSLPYCYLGYYIRDCRKMNYKTRFMPHEFLDSDGQWRRPDAPPATGPAPVV